MPTQGLCWASTWNIGSQKKSKLRRDLKSMKKRIFYSQNYIHNKTLIRKLLDKTSIDKNDLVLEIGAGEGQLSEFLAKKCKKLILFEIDKNLEEKLKSRFKNFSSVEIKGNFLTSPLPKGAYKVFSNIPFKISSQIIKKLIFSDNPPNDSYLFVQKETAQRFAGKPDNKINTLLSILIKPFYETKIVYRFSRNNFFPKPKVDILLFFIKLKSKPDISLKTRPEWDDFVSFMFGQFEPNVYKSLQKILNQNQIKTISENYKINLKKRPSEVDYIDWLNIFNLIENNSNQVIKLFEGSYNQMQTSQTGIKKIFRTRLDKNWRKKV
jgi:23S rRNA (adenine-N6)-dimethyltransferase